MRRVTAPFPAEHRKTQVEFLGVVERERKRQISGFNCGLVGLTGATG
jgi:hypothetical protein